jgi:hypothetical protein
LKIQDVVDVSRASLRLDRYRPDAAKALKGDLEQADLGSVGACSKLDMVLEQKVD